MKVFNFSLPYIHYVTFKGLNVHFTKVCNNKNDVLKSCYVYFLGGGLGEGDACMRFSNRSVYGLWYLGGSILSMTKTFSF